MSRLLGVAVVLSACGPRPPGPAEAVDCSAFAVSEAPLAVVDTNGDEAITDKDVGPGSAMAWLQFDDGTGVMDVVLTTADVRLVQNPRSRGVITWSVWLIAACDPEISVFLGFPGLEPYLSTRLEVGKVEAAGFSLDVPNFEQGLTEATIEGHVHLTAVQPSSASGYLDGTGEGAIFSYIYAAETGHSVSLRGLAFRDVSGSTGVTR